MAKRTIVAGATDQTVDVFIQDSSSLVGLGLSGLVFNTAGLKCYYRKGATGAATVLTLATQTVGGAHSDGGFVEIDATNMKGVYRLDLSDTIVASSPWVTIYLYGATNMAPVVLELEITAVNPFSSTNFGKVQLGDVAHGGTAAVLTLERAVVASTTTNEPGVKLTGNGTAPGIKTTGGATGRGLECNGGASGGAGIIGLGTSGNPGIVGAGEGLGQGMFLLGGSAGAGLLSLGQGNSDGATFTKAGTGKDIKGTLERVALADTVSSVTALASGAIQAIWDALTSAFSTSGSVGKRLSDALPTTTNAKDLFDAILTLTVDDSTFTPTTTVFETTLATNANRFTSPNQAGTWVTGNNAGESFEITGYEYSANSKVKLTIDEQRVAPANGDRFKVAGVVK